MIELLVTLAIVAVLAAISAPSMQSWLMAQRVAAAGTEILTDLQFARSEAITRDRQIRVLFKKIPGLTCYTIFVRLSQNVTTCDCTSGNANACGIVNNPDIELKTARFPESNGVGITFNIAQDTVYFLPNGRFDIGQTAGNVLVAEKNGGSKKLQVQVSAAIQRPSICTPPGSTLSGFKPC